MALNPLRPSNNLNDAIVDIKQMSLYARLKKMYSTDAIVRNIGGKKLKRVDTDEAQFATDRNSLRDRFNRVRSTSYNAYTRDFALSYQAARLDLFRDYDTMDMDPIIASALDVYSDECVTKSEFNKVITVKSDNDNIRDILDNLFNDILNVKFNLWSWVRNII
jgi:spore coat protein CotF